MFWWFNSAKNIFNQSFSVGVQQTRVASRATVRARLLMKLIKKDLFEAFIATQAVLRSGYRAFFAAYRCFSNHSIFHKLADFFSTSNKMKLYKRKGKAKLEKLAIVRTLYRSKTMKTKRNFKSTLRPILYLQQILDSEAEISSLKSYETVGATSCSSSAFVHNLKDNNSCHENDASFEILTTDDFQLSDMLSDASSDQPAKTQPLSQWDINTPNVMFDNSPSPYKQTAQINSSSCLSNSSYEVITSSKSTSKNKFFQDNAHPELPHFSFSSCSSSDMNQNLSFTSAARSPQNNSKLHSPNLSTQFSKSASSFLPYFASAKPKCIQLDPNKEKTATDFANFDSSSTNITQPINPWNGKQNTRQNERSLNKEIWSRELNFQRVLGPHNQSDKHELNINQIFPKLSTGVCDAWPIGEPQQININAWDKNRNVPVLNSLKKSFATESSFNFDDSRFNSLSPELNLFQINQTLNPASEMRISNQTEAALCDFTHLLKMSANLRPNGNNFKPRAANLGHPHFSSRFFENKTPTMAAQQSFLPSNKEFNAFSAHYTANPQGFQGSNAIVSSADRLMQIFKSQRDEINSLRTQIASDSVALAEHQTLLQEVGKDKVEKVQEIHKRSREKLNRAQNEELLRSNALLDKKILNLVKLQRRCNDAKAREYKLKTHLQWKPYEIS